MDAPTGIGKTKLLKQVVELLVDPSREGGSEPVLVIAPRVTLVQSAMAELRDLGFKSYRDEGIRLDSCTPKSNPRLVVCLPSLARMSDMLMEWFLTRGAHAGWSIVLDEASQSIDMLTSNIIEDAKRLDRVLHLIKFQHVEYLLGARELSYWPLMSQNGFVIRGGVPEPFVIGRRNGTSASEAADVVQPSDMDLVRVVRKGAHVTEHLSILHADGQALPGRTVALSNNLDKAVACLERIFMQGYVLQNAEVSDSSPMPGVEGSHRGAPAADMQEISSMCEVSGQAEFQNMREGSGAGQHVVAELQSACSSSCRLPKSPCSEGCPWGMAEASEASAIAGGSTPGCFQFTSAAEMFACLRGCCDDNQTHPAARMPCNMQMSGSADAAAGHSGEAGEVVDLDQGDGVTLVSNSVSVHEDDDVNVAHSCPVIVFTNSVAFATTLVTMMMTRVREAAAAGRWSPASLKRALRRIRLVSAETVETTAFARSFVKDPNSVADQVDLVVVSPVVQAGACHGAVCT